jgi:hypothetical protein
LIKKAPHPFLSGGVECVQVCGHELTLRRVGQLGIGRRDPGLCPKEEKRNHGKQLVHEIPSRKWFQGRLRYATHAVAIFTQTIIITQVHRAGEGRIFTWENAHDV